MVAKAILAWPRPFPASVDSLGPPPGRHVSTENAMRVRLGRAAALVAGPYHGGTRSEPPMTAGSPPRRRPPAPIPGRPTGALAGRVLVSDDPTGVLTPGTGRTWLATLP